MKLNIIDPSSSEHNRGSFCYSPYICFNGLSETHNVNLIESFIAENIDTIPDADIQLVCLWSYPQIECATMLAFDLPFSFGKDNVYFVGYAPLIEELGFRNISTFLGFDPMQDETFLRLAMRNYPKNYDKFKRLLLSDCDMHLQHLDKGELVYPLFTSYGCSQKCSFCPSTKNCGNQRIELSIEDTRTMLFECIDKGIKSIHFTDEDFFIDIDRAYKVLDYIRGEGMHLIALSSAGAAWRFIQKYGTNVLLEAGLEVMEIGFESAAEDMSQKMGVGKSLSDCEKLANIQHALPFRIFWLVMTFFPGETITSLNTTGRFMRKYGFEEEQVMGRLRTNGTKGGLGQFFQSYIGTPIYKTLERKGITLTERPVRLIPSYVPNSFLESSITEINKSNIEFALNGFNLYNIQFDVSTLKIGRQIRDYIVGKPVYEKIKIVTAFAILARAGAIE